MHPYFSLPGIRSIDYVLAERLSNNVIIQSLANIKITIYAKSTPIEFTGECTCVVESTNENNGLEQVATLTFQTQLEVPEARPLAFIITDVMGKSYLLGSKEEPYPLVTSSKTFGLPESAASVRTYEVVYKSPKALLECTRPS